MTLKFLAMSSIELGPTMASALRMIIQRAVKPLALAMGISGEGLSFPTYTLRAVLRMRSSFDKWIRWRLSLAIVGDVKCIASSRPDVHRIRRTVTSSNQRPSGDWIGGVWLTPCE